MNARFHAVQLLTEFERSGRRLSDLFKDYFEHRELLPQRRPIITYLVQETTRWRGYLDFLLSRRCSGSFRKSDPFLKNILRVGAYEILFREQVPQYAAVHEAVGLARTIVDEKASRFTNAVLHQIGKAEKPDLNTLTRTSSLEEIAAVTSHPGWMIRHWIANLGFERMLQLCRWNNTIPKFSVRRNRAKVSREAFESFLRDQHDHWERSSILGEFYILDRIARLRESPEFEMGFFSFQDVSAGLIAQLVEKKDGLQVLDVCAAPGGKATHIAERLGNQVTILAYDSDEERKRQLVKNVERLGHGSIHIACKDATSDEYPISDVVLLDVPCMGTGVMAKRADLRWRRRESDLAEMCHLQQSLLSHMSAFAKPHGVLIYSTCSLENEENWEVVTAFLGRFPHFHVRRPGNMVPAELVDDRGALRTFPPDHGIDGIFAVILEREA